MTVAHVVFDPLRDSRHRTARAARECADWLAWLELEGKAPRTLSDYERTVAVLLRTFPDRNIADIGDGDLLHILKMFPQQSRRIRRAHLASFFGWAYKTGRIDRSPLRSRPARWPDVSSVGPGVTVRQDLMPLARLARLVWWAWRAGWRLAGGGLV